MSRYAYEDEPTCGAEFEIEGHDLVGGDGSRRHIAGTTLVCSRPEGHTPASIHSDGVTDWKGDEG